ncbi:MAG: hypothetical protein P4L84_04825 [Isosphaeraceae bacterium]|nr:hypothetical protein [Isosphaeraceae bacterium]
MMDRFNGQLLDLDSSLICEVEGHYVLHGGPFPYYAGGFCPAAEDADKVIRGWDYILDIAGGPLLQIVTSNVQHATDSQIVFRFSSVGQPVDRDEGKGRE